METQAKRYQRWWFDGISIDLISSDALVFEVERIPNVYRKHYVLEVLEESNIFIELNDEIEAHAKTFIVIQKSFVPTKDLTGFGNLSGLG